MVLFHSAWDDTLVSVTSDLLTSELRPAAGGQSDMNAYKQTLAASLFFKFYLSVQMRLRAAQVRILRVLTWVSYNSQFAMHLYSA